MSAPRAKEPFRFFSRLSLTAAAGVRACDLAELLAGLKTVPDSAIYAHTHRFIQQHQFLVPEPSNDFAVWASEALQDEAAAERLLAVDPMSFDTIEELRAALCRTLEEHLKAAPPRRAPEGEEFHFLRSIRFSLPTPYEAWDLPGFAEALRKVGPASIFLHAFEARLRPPLGRNDFSVWFDAQLGEKDLAAAVAKVDPYSSTTEQLRARILKMVERRIEECCHG